MAVGGIGSFSALTSYSGVIAVKLIVSWNLIKSTSRKQIV